MIPPTSGSAPAGLPDPAELQKSFGEGVSRTSRMLGYTMPFLVLFSILLVQGIREGRANYHTAGRRMASYNHKIDRQERQIRSAYAEVWENVRNEVDVLPDQLKRIPEAGTRPDSSQIATTPARLDSMITWADTAFAQSARAAGMAEERERVQYLRESLVAWKARFEKQVKGANAQIDTLKRSYAAAKQRRAGILAETRSFSTPFGSFNLNPVLTLLGLAIAAGLAYLSFVVSAAELRRRAEAWRSAGGQGHLVAGSQSAPSWLYPVGPQLSESFGWKGQERRVALKAAALHAVWMLIAVGLSWEALRWDAHRVLRLAWPGAWVGALVLLLGIALVTAIWHFVPAARSSRAADALFREDRRKFVVAALGMLPVVALGTYFGRRLWARAAAEKKWVRLDDLPAGARGGRLVLHRATRTLHHPDACRGHLPGDGVPLSGAQIPEKTRLHPGQEILILQALARDAVRAGRTDEGIQLYQQAIALSPYSYHLYDALAGLYGHLRRYDEIFTLLKGARDRLSVPDAAARDPRAAQRRAKRAITELNTRLAGAECRRTKCNDSLVDESADSKVPAAAAPAKRDAPAAAVAESSKNP